MTLCDKERRGGVKIGQKKRYVIVERPPSLKKRMKDEKERNQVYYEKALARVRGVSRCRKFESMIDGTVDCCDFSDDTNHSDGDFDIDNDGENNYDEDKTGEDEEVDDDKEDDEDEDSAEEEDDDDKEDEPTHSTKIRK